MLNPDHEFDLFRHVVPTDVKVAEASILAIQLGLLPEESAQAAHWALRRRREFQAGRVCARRALVQLGMCRTSVIAAGPRREPLWPPGIVGSITHTDDYCAAAVAYASRVRGIGIDAALNASLPYGVCDLISSPLERECLPTTPAHDADPVTLLFSAKESLFKLLYVLTHDSYGFRDVHIDFDFNDRSFHVMPAWGGPRSLTVDWSHVVGRFAVDSHYVVTAAWLPPANGHGIARSSP